MKMKIGKHSNDVEFFDDDGNQIDIAARVIDIKLRPDEATVAYMEVYFKEIDVSLEDDLITTRRVGHR